MDTLEDKVTRLQDVNSDLVSAVNVQTQEVIGKMGAIDARMNQAEDQFEEWKAGVETIINGVPVAKVGGFYQFQRSTLISTGGYPACPNGPTYLRLLEFSANAPGASNFEVNIHTVHRGAGYSGYYEYMELRGTYAADGIGGIARRFSLGDNTLSLFRSDASQAAEETSVPGDGTVVPFVVKQLGNDDNLQTYALMLKCYPYCGADKDVSVNVRYSHPNARPAEMFASYEQPQYPNL